MIGNPGLDTILDGLLFEQIEVIDANEAAIKIERAITQNVTLNSTENVNVAQRALQISNLRALDIESRRIQPVRLH